MGPNVQSGKNGMESNVHGTNCLAPGNTGVTVLVIGGGVYAECDARKHLYYYVLHFDHVWQDRTQYPRVRENAAPL